MAFIACISHHTGSRSFSKAILRHVNRLRGGHMDELIGRLATNASIDSAVAEKTVGIILGFLRNEGPSDSVQVLIDQIPGAEAAIEASRSGAADGRRLDGGRHAPDGPGTWHVRDSEHRP